jgi:hypothetical protein
MASGATATMTVVVQPTAVGPLTNASGVAVHYWQ